MTGTRTARKVGRVSRALVISFAAGLLAGVIFWLVDTPSPVPPLVGLIGLLGIVIGEQLTRRIIARTGRKPSAERVIRALESARYAAMRTSDAASILGLSDPRLQYTHSDGRTDSSDDYVRKLRSGYYAYSTITHSTTNVLISGDTAIVTGLMDAELSVAGIPQRLHNKTLAIWVRSGSDWKFLAFQPTVLANEPLQNTECEKRPRDISS